LRISAVLPTSLNQISFFITKLPDESNPTLVYPWSWLLSPQPCHYYSLKKHAQSATAAHNLPVTAEMTATAAVAPGLSPPFPPLSVPLLVVVAEEGAAEGGDAEEGPSVVVEKKEVGLEKALSVTPGSNASVVMNDVAAACRCKTMAGVVVGALAEEDSHAEFPPSPAAMISVKLILMPPAYSSQMDTSRSAEMIRSVHPQLANMPSAELVRNSLS